MTDSNLPTPRNKGKVEKGIRNPNESENVGRVSRQTSLTSQACNRYAYPTDMLCLCIFNARGVCVR